MAKQIINKQVFPQLPAWLPWVIFLPLSFLLYFQSLSFGFFTWDDLSYVQNNELLRNGSWLDFFTGPFEGMYQPLLLISLSIDNWIGGGNPWWFHFSNILLHGVNSLLVFYFFKKIQENSLIPYLSAAIFLLHPVMVEPVSWITCRKDLLFSAFYLGGAIAWLIYLQKKNQKWYFISLLFFLLSVLSKVQAVSFPFMLMILEFLKGESPFSRNKLIQKIPFFLISLIFGGLVYYFALGTSPDIAFFDRILLSGFALSAYLFKFILPISHTVLVPFPEEIRVIHIAMALLSAFLIYLLFHFRKNKLLVSGGLFLILHLALLLPIFPNSYILMAEKYLYLSGIGILMMLIAILPSLKKSYVVFIPLILIIPSLNQIQNWKDPLDLWTQVVKKYPYSPEAWDNRAYAYYAINDYERSAEDYQKSINLNPNAWNSRANAGAVLSELKQYESAILHLNKALELKPGDELAHYNRAIALQNTGKFTEALKDIDEAVGQNPENADYLLTRGAILLNMNQFDAALNDLNRSILKNPKNHLSYGNRGLCNIRLNKTADAYKDFSQAILLNPKFPDAWSNRGMLQLNQGNYQLALEDFNQALKADPGFAMAYLNRGRTWLALGYQTQACSDFQQVKSMGLPYADREIQQYCAVQPK